MNKTEIISIVAEKAGTSKRVADMSVCAVLDIISESLKNGEKVSLIGFGNFEVRERAAREGKNPRTGEKIKIAACKTPAFKSGKALKEIVQ